MNEEQLRGLLAQPRFHRFLEMRLIEADAAARRLRIALPFKSDYCLFDPPGNLHGGIIASLADVAGTFACMMVAGKPTPTINLRVDYLAAPPRPELTATATVLPGGASVLAARIEVAAADGTLVASACGNWLSR